MVQRQLQMKQNIGQIIWLDNTPNQPSKFGAKNGLQQVMIPWNVQQQQPN